ncbi:efflux RND transporter periplasmic adaptor subunit [Anaeromyxobacter oryzisoli]|uniref:efflux RND transporter periplasmic adaptor subunit n=1 Tax=Anaeromyxobacter oryzisoli TaxID=2925408 RepID=UPI001F5658EB|nr:efflux RND transporter periplasmic adaptor subunit [Anaeromyxobacter sp. SG63]
MPRVFSASIATLLLLVGCGRGAGAPAAASASVPNPPPPAGAAPTPARLAVPERVRFSPRVVATGTLKARQASPLAFPVPGTLARVAVRRGQEVRAGALLAALDDGAAAAACRQAEAAVAAGRAQLALAEDGLARVGRLRQEDGASEAQAFQARAQRDLAAAQVAGAEAQLAQARVNLSHHHLTAPFAGVVTRIPDGVGIAVAAGTPVVTLVTTRELILETTLTQEEAAELRPGARATISVPATGARAEATVSVVVPAVDASTSRVPVELAVPNAAGRFLPNAYARAELPRGAPRDAWRVPSAALLQRDGGRAVWVAGRDGVARALAVRLLGEEGDLALVAPEDGAPWPGELRVVEDPPLGLAEGTSLAEVRG